MKRREIKQMLEAKYYQSMEEMTRARSQYSPTSCKVQQLSGKLIVLQELMSDVRLKSEK